MNYIIKIALMAALALAIMEFSTSCIRDAWRHFQGHQ